MDINIYSACFRGEAASGAAIVRPPGHHAESAMSMGFCFFNNAALAARAAQAAGARRVLILDWDVHHGMFFPERSCVTPVASTCLLLYVQVDARANIQFSQRLHGVLQLMYYESSAIVVTSIRKLLL